MFKKFFTTTLLTVLLTGIFTQNIFGVTIEVPTKQEQDEYIERSSKYYTVSHYLSENYNAIAVDDFIIDTKRKEISKYANWYKEDIVVPSVVNGLEIDTIRSSAFMNRQKLKNVVIEEGIKLIGGGAFRNCYNLKSVTIPSTVNEIWLGAFYGVDTIYLPYHTYEQLNGSYFSDVYKADTNNIWGARRAVYGTGQNQVIIEDKEYVRVEKGSNNIDTKNDSAKSVKLKVGEKLATVNGVSVALDTPAYINSSNNSVYVPLRFVAVSLVGEDNMLWDASTKTVAIFKGDKSIKFTIGNNNMIVNGKPVNMGNGIVPEIKDGRVFVPFRPLGEALGKNVKWDSNTKTAIYE